MFVLGASGRRVNTTHRKPQQLEQLGGPAVSKLARQADPTKLALIFSSLDLTRR